MAFFKDVNKDWNPKMIRRIEERVRNSFEGMRDLLFESGHVPMSVSLADILDRAPEHISSKDPKELIRRFWEALECRVAAIREDMRRYIPEEIEFLPKQQQKRISQWCFQTLAGFNSRRYDLILIKKKAFCDPNRQRQWCQTGQKAEQGHVHVKGDVSGNL